MFLRSPKKRLGRFHSLLRFLWLRQISIQVEVFVMSPDTIVEISDEADTKIGASLISSSAQH